MPTSDSAKLAKLTMLMPSIELNNGLFLAPHVVAIDFISGERGVNVNVHYAKEILRG